MNKVILPLVSFMAVSIGSQTGQACCSAVGGTTKPEMKPANLVVEPHYLHGKKTTKKHRKTKACSRHKHLVVRSSHAAVEKLEYEPVTSELPALEEQEAQVEAIHGIEYEKGVDLFITASSGYAMKDGEIPEDSEESAALIEAAIVVARI